MKHIIRAVAVIILLLITAVIVLLYSSRVQTSLAQYFTKKYLNKNGFTVTFHHINISPFHSVFIDDLLITENSDTLMYCEQIASEIRYFSYLNSSLILKETHLYNGGFYLQQDTTGKLNINRFISLFTSKQSSSAKWDIDFGKVYLSEMAFKYQRLPLKQNTGGGDEKVMDYGNIQARHISGEVKKIELDSGKITFHTRNLSLSEKSGFKIEDISTQFTVSPGQLLFDSLRLQTEHSFISGTVHLKAQSFRQYSHFVDSVKLTFVSDSSVIQLDEINYFSPANPFINEHVVLKGKITGYINRFRSKNIYANFSSGTTITGDMDISQITRPEQTFFFLKIKKLYTSKQAVELLSERIHHKISLPGNFSKLGLITYSGTLTGFYNDFVLYGNLITAQGNLTTDISIRNDKQVAYSGELSSQGFNFGQLLGMSKHLKNVALDVQIKGNGTTVNTINAAIDGQIHRLDFQDYVYRNFDVNGVLSNGYFKGNFSINDTNLQLTFDGLIDLKSKTPYFNFETHVKKANLTALHLLPDTLYNPVVSFHSYVSLSLKNSSFAHGNIQLKDIEINDKTGRYTLPQFDIISLSEQDEKNIQIQSPIISGGISGDFDLSVLHYQLLNRLSKYYSFITPKQHIDTLTTLNARFSIHADPYITKYFLHDTLQVVNGQLLSEVSAQQVNFIFNSKNTTYNGYLFDDVNITLQADTTVELTATINQVRSNDSILVNNFNLNTIVQNDSVMVLTEWKKKDQTDGGSIHLHTFFADGILQAHFSQSYYILNQLKWQTDHNNTLTYKIADSTLRIQHLKLFNSDSRQQILIDGEISKNPEKELDILIENFDLSLLNYFVDKKIIETQGRVNGTFTLQNVLQAPIMNGHLTVDDLSVNTIFLGRAELNSIWNNADKKLSLTGEIKYGAVPSILLKGNYLPFDKHQNLDFVITTHQTDIKLFAPYIENIISDLQGSVTGNIFLKGTTHQPEFTGQLALNNPKFKINYLNTYFSAPSIPFYLYDDFIAADNIQLFDQEKNPLFVNISLAHKHFTNLNFDVSGITDKAFVLNTNEIQNNLFYGQAFVSGEFDVSGDSKQLFVDLNITTLKGTSLNIPIDQTESLESFDFVKFITTDTLKRAADTVKESKLDINLSVLSEITPETEIKIIFDKQLGDIIRSKGSGNLKITYANEEFNIFGDYKIINGDYLFTLQNVINKKFDIISGSTIHWSGDVYEGELNIDASYKLRTRLYDLLSAYDSTDFYKRRIPVEVKLKMTNTLISPTIRFDIDLPTADQTTKDLVKSVLLINANTGNNQELNKQVFALLVLHRFLPPPGATNSYEHSGFVSTSSSELLSNQLSNWLSQLSSDFDIGFNYRPGDELSSQEVNLALSTQIFNDRLIIDGNVGYASNKYNPTGTSALIGDINLEYKISNDGNLRIKAFNKTNANNYYFNNSPYTQGAGIFYQEEFNTTREFFKKFFGRFSRKHKNNTTQKSVQN